MQGQHVTCSNSGTAGPEAARGCRWLTGTVLVERRPNRRAVPEFVRANVNDSFGRIRLRSARQRNKSRYNDRVRHRTRSSPEPSPANPSRNVKRCKQSRDAVERALGRDADRRNLSACVRRDDAVIHWQSVAYNLTCAASAARLAVVIVWFSNGWPGPYALHRPDRGHGRAVLPVEDSERRSGRSGLRSRTVASSTTVAFAHAGAPMSFRRR